MADSPQESKPQKCSCQRVSNAIVSFFENAFFRLGKAIGNHPYLTILISLLFAGICCVGILEFTQESRGEKLWSPSGAEVQKDMDWVESHFPKSRTNKMIFEGTNVLTPQSLKTILVAHNEVLNIYNGTDKEWSKICFRRGQACQLSGILELWDFNDTIINSLTAAEILAKVNEVNLTSPTTNLPLFISQFIGARTIVNGSIVSANAAMSTYFLKNQEVIQSGKKVDKDGEDWENAFDDVASKSWPDFTVTFSTLTRNNKDSGDAINGDIALLSIGYILIIIYLSLMLGKLTRLHLKVWLGLLGVLCVGLAIGVSFGVSSALGFFYGPVHSVLPFLILGIGVDDVFVIVQSWENVLMKPESKDLSVAMKIAMTMKHAGMAISVTSLTDTTAFLIGATTILPALRSFCIYAGIGILAMFIFSCTTFVAFLALDAKRLEKRQDACLYCCLKVPEDYKPAECNDTNKLQRFFENVYSKYLLQLPVKIVVFVITISVFAVSFYGLMELKQDFDFNWFLPDTSKSALYNAAQKKYFPSEGGPTAAYLGDIDYFSENVNMKNLYDVVSTHNSVSPSTTKSWHREYLKWISANKVNDSGLDSFNYPKNKTIYVQYLLEFFQTDGVALAKDVMFKNSTSGSGLEISASRITTKHLDFDGASPEIKAMDGLMEAVKSVPFSGPRAFVYSFFYVPWNTNKVISTELLRNILLATLCVFITTLFLLANFWAALMVLSCVAFTLVNVAGMMHFWGLTVDTVSTVVLLLSVGLCVDYAVHIAHAFLTSKGDNRNDRVAKALTEIGPAVLNGGISTFLAFCALGASGSYVFKVFFKVFLLIVVFGLFHGLVYLPCLLSLIGPPSYATNHVVEPHPKNGVDNPAVELENGVSTNGKYKQTNGEKINESFHYTVEDLGNMKAY